MSLLRMPIAPRGINKRRGAQEQCEMLHILDSPEAFCIPQLFHESLRNESFLNDIRDHRIPTYFLASTPSDTLQHGHQTGQPMNDNVIAMNNAILRFLRFVESNAETTIHDIQVEYQCKNRLENHNQYFHTDNQSVQKRFRILLSLGGTKKHTLVRESANDTTCRQQIGGNIQQCSDSYAGLYFNMMACHSEPDERYIDRILVLITWTYSQAPSTDVFESLIRDWMDMHNWFHADDNVNPEYKKRRVSTHA